MRTYAYGPLSRKQDIRILKLNAGSIHDPLRGSLAPRKDDESYEVLLWAMEEGNESSRISLHDEGGVSNFLHIKPDLGAALKSLRPRQSGNPHRKLWIDAICVNWKDIQEKNKQVAMMAQILRQATRVCLWLGSHDHDSRKAIEFMRSKILDLARIDYHFSQESSLDSCIALASFLNRPCFEQHWMVQGIVLARNAAIYCGEDCLSWDQFEAAVSLFRVKYDSLARHPAYSAYNFGDIRAFSAVRLVEVTSTLVERSESGGMLSRSLSIEDLVFMLSDFKVREPHDLIYSVLALGSGTGLLESQTVKPVEGKTGSTDSRRSTTVIAVDYGQDFFEVCKKFMAFTISRSGSFDLILQPWAHQAASRLPRSKNTLPSWITMTGPVHQTQASSSAFGGVSRVRASADPLLKSGLSRSYRYKASWQRARPANWRLGTGDKGCSLFVTGFILDAVGERGESAGVGMPPPSWLELTEDVERSDAFWRTLVADRTMDGRTAPKYYSRAFMHARQPGFMVDEHGPFVVDEFIRRVRAVTWKRRMITLRNEHEQFGKEAVIGLAPERTWRTDIIAIIEGCSVPVVLRHVRGTETYSLIGEAYIHGYMDGQACSLQEYVQRAESTNYALKEQMKTREFELS
ncbi:hypothetical protein EJ05DRAFT_500470 [Pseudovirgaria hyperparasitica]|uniref:Heterokaryon incompatibility domain-containing protein n=1 Tax=Pseudovirgaria hyperparasitica TaxID=470096 RepID=A0A6A6W502_9PEZI|nr:uncharacterized protein EJ05DRAFT_500470 [Pseudovirgaria hyperparasitica]KAF2757952.1 hypothetical protein EJ05DRAFT_500470 [Pseudovirgaria hyperparasitica]